ncbi:MAG TPA: hypothetical protein VGQ08_17705 [Nitrospiraceae bacterium]|nr:hypothetical protein [Nitrospiraceae bacterium]
MPRLRQGAAEPLRVLIEDLRVIAETARPKVKTVIVRQRRKTGTVGEPPSESTVPRQKKNGVQGRSMRYPLL